MQRYCSSNEPTSTTPSSVSIEKCFRSQLKELRVFAESVLAKDHPGIHDWFEKYYDEFCRAKRHIWVAREGTEIIGFLISRMDNLNDAKLSALFVKESYRKLEIESHLLEAFERYARAGEYKAAHLYVYADETDAISFFKNHGWRVMKDNYHHPFENPERARYLMIKRPLSFLRH